MKTLTHLAVFALLTLGSINTGLAQQIVAEVGRTTTNFDYQDSNGATLENLFPRANVTFSLGYRRPLTDRIFYSGNLLFNHYGTEGSNETLQARYSWDVQYVGIGVGVDAEVFRKKGFAALVRVAAEPQVMTGGTQTINDELFDLRGVEQFDRPFLFLRGTVGLNYCTDEKAVVTMRYSYGRGNPIGGTSDSESLILNTGTFSIGLLWNLSNCRYCHERKLR